MSKVPIHQLEIDLQTILAGFSKMGVKDLEGVVQEINALIVRKKSKTKKYQQAALLQAINKTVLSAEKRITFKQLYQKLQEETMTPEENNAFLVLADEEANLRNQRVKYMIELAQLRQIPFPQLMSELGLEPLHA